MISPLSKISRFLFKRFRRSTPKEKHQILIYSDRFEITLLGDSALPANTVAWSSIIEATAFKIDLFAYDQVCISFRLDDSSETEVDEEMKGWSELIDLLPVYLPGAPSWEDWFMEITVPAFQTNPVCLFLRESQV